MPISIRPATASDLPQMADLLIADAEQRESRNPVLWSLSDDAHEKVESAVRAGLDGANSSIRELWLIAEASGRPVGIAHAMMLPVPPIYAGAWGAPGLILDDSYIVEDAPSGTAEALLAAAEAALRDVGARLLVASCAGDAQWRSILDGHGYDPVTLYMGKANFDVCDLPAGVRSAVPDDVPGIVAASAEHRKTLARLHPFWTLHPDADARFGNWMRRSLTLTDRDMLVCGAPDDVHGYAIAQPISPLLIPAAHDIKAVGVLDDFYHKDFANVSEISHGGSAVADLLSAAESAFAKRNFKAALVVCPAAWRSKISVLEKQGYRIAKLWMLKP